MLSVNPESTAAQYDAASSLEFYQLNVCDLKIQSLTITISDDFSNSICDLCYSQIQQEWEGEV